jgi:O-antigen/teichoic acid export membrane protein
MLEGVFSQGLGMIFGIILARMLSPNEFGILGMITIFISIAQVFVDSGLSQALIRKQNCTHQDYTTIFWSNIFLGGFSYVIICFSAPYISVFFEKPELTQLTRIASIVIIISSFTLIQQTILVKKVDFKMLAKISTVGTFISGAASLVLAFYGFGVWSLVWRTIINQAVRSLMMWQHNKWSPELSFNKKIFSELFSFGSNILIISIVASILKNFYNLIIGKNYSATILGYYTNAEQYSTLPSSTISNITNKVGFPVLSEIQDDNIRLKNTIRKLTKTIMYISFFVMFGLAAVAEPLFFVLFGEKWLPAVPFFQTLCLAYSITPMHIINHNIMKVKGRSDLFLKTELIKYLLFIPFLYLGLTFGINVLVAGIVVLYWIGFVINAMYSGKLIEYSISGQFLDFFPMLLLFSIPAALVYFMGRFLEMGNFSLLIIQSTVYLSVSVLLSVILKITAYLEIKEILLNKFTVNNLVNTINKS